MAMKLICGYLLVLALLGCTANAQYPIKPQLPRPPQIPNYPQLPVPPQRPPPQKYTPPQTQQPKQPTESFHTCEVEDHYKIQCGVPGVSASECQAINCCFDGRTCYYGKSVTLQCTKDAQIIVVVARDATLPNIDLELITFLGDDEICKPVGITSAFAIYQFPASACGTVMTEEPGVIIYENRMSSLYEVAIGPSGSITRDSHLELLVQCRYLGTKVEALVVEIGLLAAPPPVAAPGPLRVELRLANGQCDVKGCVEEDVAYNSFYVDSDYPITKVLRDPVYVEVRLLQRTDPNLVLTLGRCWATADPYPHSFPQWDLLIDGCPYSDDRYLTTLVPVGPASGLSYPSHHRRFIFKMFTFVATGDSNTGKDGVAYQEVMTPLKEKVYIHCDTAVCQPSPQNNCEPRCFRRRREIPSTYIRTSRPETTVVSSQKIVIVDSKTQ